MNRIVIVLVASTVFLGCATAKQQIDSHAPAMNSWLGAPIEEFLGVQGDPSDVVYGDNHQTYVFDARKTKRVVKWGQSCNQKSPDDPQSCEDYVRHSHVSTFTCSYELVVVENVINAWSMNGNHCRMVVVNHRPG